MVLTFETMNYNEISPKVRPLKSVKATEKYFPVILFYINCAVQVVLTFESVDKILRFAY